MQHFTSSLSPSRDKLYVCQPRGKFANPPKVYKHPSRRGQMMLVKVM